MKILLIRPPSSHIEGSACPSASLPLGLLFIASVLEKNGFVVEIYDAQVNATMPTYHDPDGKIHMGDKWDVVEEEIKKRQPSLVGITCLFTTQMENVIKTAEIIKRLNKEIIIVVGGSHATVRPEDFLTKTETIDIVCRGEGEYTMLDIAESLRDRKSFNDIDGTAVRDGIKIKINRQRPYTNDLDTLPFPSYHLINIESYFSLNKKGFSGRPAWFYDGFERAVSLITSRGCPFNCVFCSIHGHMGRKWRGHSAEYVLRHIEFLTTTYSVKHIHFEDDNLTLDGGRFKNILNGLLGGMNITWDTPNGVRADTMTEEMLRDCKKSGCIYLIFGVESGNQKVLDEIIGKRLNLDTVVQVASWCKAAQIDAMAFFVIGFPGETKQNMDDTVNFALRLQRKYDIMPSLFVATPLPGTRLEKICLEEGILKSQLSPQNLAKMTQGAFLIDSSTFRADEINSLLKKFYKRFKLFFIYNSLIFLIRHPKAFLRIFIKLYKENPDRVNKESIFNMLLYKNCLLK